MTAKFAKLLGAGAGVAVLALAALAHAAEPERGSGVGFPRDVSVDGYRIDWLINITTVFCLILFVIMVIWMAIAIFAHGKNHRAQYDHGNARRQAMVACVLSAVIFFVVDGNLFVTSMIDLDEAFWNFDKAESHPDAVRIELNGHQWAWDVRYAGPDGRFSSPDAPSEDDIVLLNEMYVPTGVPVIIQMGAVDVLHSLYLPNVRVKQDLVPGNITRAWFEAKETGTFEIACAQHCGVNHYKMRGVLTIMEREAYDRWLVEASANAQHSYDPKDPGRHWGWEWKKDF